MIAIGCDHGGIIIKNAVIDYMKENGIEYTDFGCYTEESVDYPIYAYKVARAVADGRAEPRNANHAAATATTAAARPAPTASFRAELRPCP